MMGKAKQDEALVAEPMEGEVVANWELTRPLPPAGKGAMLNPAAVAAICETIAAGNYIDVACRAAGISRPTFHQWMRKAADDPNSVYAEFADLLERARSQAEADNVSVIKNAAEKTWQAAAWLLERQYPDRWGRRDRVFNTVSGDHRVTFVFEDKKLDGK